MRFRLFFIILLLPLLITKAAAQHLYSLPRVSCGNGFGEKIGDGHPQPLMAFSEDSLTECARLYKKVNGLAQGSSFQAMYDSSKHIIELCPTYQDVWRDFGVANTGCQYMSNDTLRWVGFREWLKKVLYYNSDSFYYCADVQSILSTFQYFEGRGNDLNGLLAIFKYIHDSNKCSTGIFADKDFESRWNSTRIEQYNKWLDSAGNNPNHKPALDTTLPTLEDLDLQVLRGPQYAAVKNAFTPSTTKKLLYLTASENPFTDETTLRFGLSDKEYIKLEVFDLLGKVIYSDGGLFTEGDRMLRIEGKGIARGQLYARLSTMGGEVLTIQLVRE